MKASIFLLFAVAILAGILPKARGADRPGKDFALFFAVENYDYWDPLSMPIDDAREIAKDLEDLYDFEVEVVVDPTRNQIIDKLDEYARRSWPDDAQLLVFFSGHGDYVESRGEGFFIPRDGKKEDRYNDSHISFARLNRNISSIPCKHILLAIDACYSGTIDHRPMVTYRGEDRFSRPGEGPASQRLTFINNSLRYATRLYVTSGGAERTPDPSQFASMWKEGLRSFGGNDGILLFRGELYNNYLMRANPAPRSGQLAGNEEGANFLFVLSDRHSPPQGAVEPPAFFPDLPPEGSGRENTDPADPPRNQEEEPEEIVSPPRQDRAARTTVQIVYAGDQYNCALPITISIGDVSLAPQGNVVPMEGVPVGQQPYVIQGNINCGLLGSCTAYGEGYLNIQPNAVFNVIWQNTSVGACSVILAPSD